MADRNRPLNWFQRACQYLFGWPPKDRREPSRKPQPAPHPATPTSRPVTSRMGGGGFSSTHIPLSTSSSDLVTQSVIVDQVDRIQSLANNLDRQADRFENAGNFERAEELRNAAAEARASGDFGVAESIVAAVDADYSGGNDFSSSGDFASGVDSSANDFASDMQAASDFDPAVDDPMGDPAYSDNS